LYVKSAILPVASTTENLQFSSGNPNLSHVSETESENLVVGFVVLIFPCFQAANSA